METKRKTNATLITAKKRFFDDWAIARACGGWQSERPMALATNGKPARRNSNTLPFPLHHLLIFLPSASQRTLGPPTSLAHRPSRMPPGCRGLGGSSLAPHHITSICFARAWWVLYRWGGIVVVACVVCYLSCSAVVVLWSCRGFPWSLLGRRSWPCNSFQHRPSSLVAAHSRHRHGIAEQGKGKVGHGHSDFPHAYKGGLFKVR